MNIERLIALCIVGLAYGLVGLVFYVLIVGGLKASGKGGK
jgi:hypothetical protein